MRFFVAPLIVAAGWVATAAPLSAAEWSIELATLPGGVVDLFEDQGKIVALTRSGAFFRIGESAVGQTVTERLGSYRQQTPMRRPDMLPDGIVTSGRGDLTEAYLTGPTSRYRHGVLGDAIEASGLSVRSRSGAILEFKLPPDSVFEDLAPRLHDIDGDGRDEILVVRSYLDAGAALAVLGVKDGKLELIAETAPIGQPNRWLNPIGVADFDGDGRPEVALVKTPHIGGILEVYELGGRELKMEHSARGFSNHFIGSRDLDLSHLADMDGDGIADIVVPSADRSALRVVSFAGGVFKDLGESPLPARVSTRMAVIDLDSGAFAFGLASGVLAIVHKRAPASP